MLQPVLRSWPIEDIIRFTTPETYNTLLQFVNMAKEEAQLLRVPPLMVVDVV